MRLRVLTAVSVIAGIAAMAPAQTKPTIWVGTDHSVSTTTTTNCDVVRMVVPFLTLNISRSGSEQDRFQSAYDDGVATAEAVCDTIHDEPPARLALHFFGWGAGGRHDDPDDVNSNYWENAPTVLFHPADRLTTSCSSGPHFQQTPWPDHAKAECSAWMKGFCRQFAARRKADSTIPAPEHFSFDMEAGLGGGNYLYDTLVAWTTYIDCLMSDPRSGASSSDVALWRYLPGNLGEQKTLAQSYREAKIRYDGESSDTVLPLSSGNPDPSAIMSASGLEQRLFITWLNGMWVSVASDVMDTAVRPVAEAYFPGCTFGNYNFLNADGGVSATAQPYVYNSPFGDHLFNNNWWQVIDGTSGYRLAYDNYGGWNNRATSNLLSVDSPSFYPMAAVSGWVSTTEDFNTEYWRFMGGQLDAINSSNDGVHRHRIIPWMIGQQEADDWGFTFNDNWYRDTYALGRSKGVKDWLLFEPGHALCCSRVQAIDQIMGDVWGPKIGCVVENMGTFSTGNPVALLSESDGENLHVPSIYFSGVYAANFIVKFKVPTGFSPDKIKVAYEAYTTFDDSSSPTTTYDTVTAARIYRTTDSNFFHSHAVVIGGTTPVPSAGSFVADPASDFTVSTSTSGVCSTASPEVWIFIGAQTQGGFTPKAFTLHVDHVMVYGFE